MLVSLVYARFLNPVSNPLYEKHAIGCHLSSRTRKSRSDDLRLTCIRPVADPWYDVTAVKRWTCAAVFDHGHLLREKYRHTPKKNALRETVTIL